MAERKFEFSKSRRSKKSSDSVESGEVFELLRNHTQAGVLLKKGETITLYSKKKIDWFRKVGTIA